ncbi:MAG: DNA polymerase III subunit delta' [Armatimonadota bacterium]|nr:DNA polymerase III subunit delta' [Armatimonadota bacterium]
MRMGELVGHERPAALLQRSLVGGHVANAYLFTGEEGLGKTTMALAFGRALVCDAPEVQPHEGVYEACGRCRSCYLSLQGNHPHLRLIAPLGEHIRIDQMRDLRHDVSLTSFAPGRRAYVVTQAQAMTEESANCILKTLEEPPPGVTLILVSESPAQLLPTITSRCLLVRFRPAPAPAVEELLRHTHGVPAEQAHLLALLSGGRPGWAVRAAGNPAILQVRTQLLSLLQRLPDAEPVEVFRIAEELRLLARELAPEDASDATAPSPGAASNADRLARAQYGPLLDLIRSWFRDLLVLKLARAVPLMNNDCAAELAHAASRYSVRRVLDALSAAGRTRFYLSRNANAAMALEVLAAGMLGEG